MVLVSLKQKKMLLNAIFSNCFKRSKYELIELNDATIWCMIP